MKQNQLGVKTNWWKWACLALLALNLAFLGVLASRIITIREPNASKITETKTDAISVGTFTTDKEKLNQTILSYLEPYQSNKMTYKLYASNDTIMFEGSYSLLGYDLPLYVYFEPYKLENGAVQLKVTSFSVGTLPLPEKEVLQYIKSSYDLPDIVAVKPSQSAIIINLQNMKNTNGIFIKANKIDLVNDEITFDIYKKNLSN
ncbi:MULTISPECIES: YpmS family protein [Streptococcus]|uniref:Uncharacterized protein YpmS n=1 Tax=Streptococcus porcorum TaxID=701526 RepID=A0ABV2JD22_9STRE|nr:YpmS family protein [Streptococcus sp.]MDY3823832.1 YpmS family protein [Streptococcus sp.]